MALTIYEVVSGGTKKHHPSGGEDWSVIVAARSPEEARNIAYGETEIDHPWVIYEWGVDARASAEPGVLRGPFENCPAVCRGWKMYQEDPSSDAEFPPIIEWRIDEPPSDQDSKPFMRLSVALDALVTGAMVATLKDDVVAILRNFTEDDTHARATQLAKIAELIVAGEKVIIEQVIRQSVAKLTDELREAGLTVMNEQ